MDYAVWTDAIVLTGSRPRSRISYGRSTSVLRAAQLCRPLLAAVFNSCHGPSAHSAPQQVHSLSNIAPDQPIPTIQRIPTSAAVISAIPPALKIAREVWMYLVMTPNFGSCHSILELQPSLVLLGHIQQRTQLPQSWSAYCWRRVAQQSSHLRRLGDRRISLTSS